MDQLKEMSSVTEFDSKTFTPYGYFNDVDKINIKENINKLVNSILTLYHIIDKFDISFEYRYQVETYDRLTVEYIQKFANDPNLDQTSLASNKSNLLNNFLDFYQTSLGQRAMNSNSSLLYLSTFIKSFVINDDFFKSHYNLNVEEVEKERLSNFEMLINNAEKSSEILEELQKRTSEYPVSDYAGVFETESNKNKIFAKNWLYCGIGLSIIFILSIILFSAFGWFEIVIRDVAGKLLYYNFSNLFTKVVLVAIQVFFISFSFKQFNVNKHLETLNKHRQNALNSYKLFQQSIIGNDNGSHNALMIQVAKSIYEHPQSTGFLNENGQQMNSGIVELTKIIGDNKTN